MLYLIATPIGNLSDITFRAIETLQSSDYILCEDTRHSGILLHHYNIVKPLKSYHKFNEAFRADGIISDLQEGKKIALISDAGTPGICDPGADLVQLCVERGLPVTVIPGPCALIQAIASSGFCTKRFQFIGFLPRKESEIKKELASIFAYPGTSICYESPHRILSVLELIHSMQESCQLAIARELTKKFEEIVRGSAATLINHWKERVVKGEIVLVISPCRTEALDDWSSWSIEEHVDWTEKTYGVSRMEAIKLVAGLRGVPKRAIYQQIHIIND